jgi:hypothetical protein
MYLLGSEMQGIWLFCAGETVASVALGLLVPFNRVDLDSDFTGEGGELRTQ